VELFDLASDFNGLAIGLHMMRANFARDRIGFG
jgi:hypothetical protein